MATINSIDSNIPIQVALGGTANTTNGTNGQVLVGGAANPVWANITAGTGITVTNGAGTISIAASGSTLIESITGNSGISVVPSSGVVSILGTGVLTSVGTTNTLTFDLVNGTNGQVLIGGGTVPTWATLTAGTGITITNAANAITIAASGSTLIESITPGSGISVVPSGGVISVPNGSNINTVGTANTLTINLTNSVTISGNYTTTAGNVTLPAQTSAVGQLIINGYSVINTYGASSANVFVGPSAGNFTLTTASAIQNSSTGDGSLTAITTGSENCAFGYNSGVAITSGTNNCLLGQATLGSVSTGSYNIAIGTGAGGSLASSESSNIYIGSSGVVGESNVMRIGTTGTGNGQVNKAYIAGAFSNYGVNNTFVGGPSGNTTLTTGSAQQNTGVGSNVLTALTSGSVNSVFGYVAGSALVSGTTNTLIGAGAGNSVTSGSSNSCLGVDAAPSFTSGSRNLILGYLSGTAYTGAESNNILLSNAGVVGESNVMRLGTTGLGAGQVNSCYIAGAYGAVISGSALLMNSSGGIGTVVSSIRYKENVEDLVVDTPTFMSLRPVTFTYKTDVAKEKRFGLIAEEVQEVLPELVLYDTKGQPEAIKYQDLPVFLLLEFKKFFVDCSNTLSDLTSDIGEIYAKIKKLSERVDKLEKK